MTATEQPHSNLEIKRDIFFGGFTARYDLSISNRLSSDAMLALLEQILRQLIPKDAFNNGIIRDLKGRDPQNLIDQALPPGLKPAADELFFMAASYPVTVHVEEEIESADQTARTEKFTVAIESNFSSFEGAAHIRHQTRLKSSGGVPDGLQLPHLTGFPELAVSHARVGIDLFQTHSFSFLGFAPFVSQTLLIEIDRSLIRLRIDAERLPSRSSLPLARLSLLENLSAIFGRILNFDIRSDYLRSAD